MMCLQCFIIDILQVVGRVEIGQKKASGLIFAEYALGMIDTPYGLQTHINAATSFTRQWIFATKVKKSRSSSSANGVSRSY